MIIMFYITKRAYDAIDFRTLSDALKGEIEENIDYEALAVAILKKAEINYDDLADMVLELVLELPPF